ncbi:MAG: N-acetyltransferase [Pseudomonadota bacterium]
MLSGDIKVREVEPADQAALEAFYPLAFPDEDLVPLLRALLDERQDCFSLVPVAAGEPVGHVAFTRCRLSTVEAPVALLGPLAVTPRFQRRGLGSALTQAGFEKLADEAVVAVLVLGDPGYYGRFGFSSDHGVEPPCPLPSDWRPAWQARWLGSARLAGRLLVPPVWQEPALWAP